MATTIAQLIATLGLDASDFHKGVDDTQRKSSVLGNAMRGMGMIGGGILAAGFTAATTAVTILASSIGPASDLNESINAVNVVFTDAADILHEYGKTSAETVGLSTRAFNQLSTVTGAFLTNLGYDSDGAAEETIKLTERAADMASVFNTDVSDALAAIQSGLKGEFNPLEQFGVKMNAAAIEAKVLEMGLASTKDEITDNHKATAALALIYEQTDKVAGDFANTSDGLANQQRILSGKIENLRAKLGTALLPIVTRVGSALLKTFESPKVQAFIDKLIGGLERLSKWFEIVMNRIDQDGIMALFTSFEDGSSYIGAFIEILGVSEPIAQQWGNAIAFAFRRGGDIINWFVNQLRTNEPFLVATFAVVGSAIAAFVYTTVIPAAISVITALAPVIAVMLLIGAVAYIGYKAWSENWGGIQQKTAAVINYIRPFIQQAIQWLQTNIPVALQHLSNLWTNVLLPAIMRLWAWVNSTLFPLFRQLIDLFVNIGKQVGVLVGILDTRFGPSLRNIGSWMQTTLMPVLQKVGGYLFTTWVNGFRSISNGIQIVTGALQKLNSMLQTVKPPAWLTPGSPTPFELGLRGIANAMEKVNNTGLPSLSANGSLSASAPMGGGGGSAITINFTSNGITDEKEAARKIAGAVDVILREKRLT